MISHRSTLSMPNVLISAGNLSFTAASTAEVGLFGQAFFDSTGIWPNAEWLVISLVAAALIWFVAYGDVRVATRARRIGVNLAESEGLAVGENPDS